MSDKEYKELQLMAYAMRDAATRFEALLARCEPTRQPKPRRKVSDRVEQQMRGVGLRLQNKRK